MISGAAPGPICGWTYIEPFGPLGGQFTFTPGLMSMDSFDADDYPIAAKPLTAPLASVFGLSGQFSFTEYPTPPNINEVYQLLINNSPLTETILLSLFGDGSIFFQVGDPNTIPTYTGTWTPNMGAHVVHFSVDGVGVPTLYIDDVAIPLTFLAAVVGTGSFYPANSVSYGGGAGDATPAISPLRNIFVTAGAVGPETVFCCP